MTPKVCDCDACRNVPQPKILTEADKRGELVKLMIEDGLLEDDAEAALYSTELLENMHGEYHFPTVDDDV